MGRSYCSWGIYWLQLLTFAAAEGKDLSIRLLAGGPILELQTKGEGQQTTGAMESFLPPKEGAGLPYARFLPLIEIPLPWGTN